MSQLDFSSPDLDTTTPATPPSSPNPLDLLLHAASPHGYGTGPDGESAAVTVRTHAPKVNLSPDPTDKERALTAKIQTLFSEARDYRRPLVGQWDRNYRMLYNRPRNIRRPDYVPTPLVPEIHTICAGVVGWMTDQQVKYAVAPNAVPHSSFFTHFQTIASDLEAVLDASFLVNEEENQWTQVIWDAVTYGTGLAKTTWDMVLASGKGDSVTRRVSPYSIYPDPAATSLTDANYIIEAKKLTVQELDRRFPGAARLFEYGGYSEEPDEAPTRLGTINKDGTPASSAQNGAMGGVKSKGYGENSGGGPTPGVMVYEAWIREHESYDTIDQNSGEKETRTYETWRVVVVAENRVLLDEPASNLWSHGSHPYSRLVLWDNGGEFWGEALVSLLIPAQLMLNRLLAAIQQNIELTGNPIFRQAQAGAGGRKVLENRPGSTIPINDGDNQTGWLTPPSVNGQLLQMLDYYLERMEMISGLSAITKGANATGRPSEDVVNSLQEAAFGRVRQHLKYYEYAMRDAGWKKASLISENYTSTRMMAIAGATGERTSMTLRARHFMVQTSEGFIPLQFALAVNAGSRLHTSRVAREDRAIQLFTLGAIDRTTLLNDIKYPNANQVARIMDDKEAAMAEIGATPGPGAREQGGHTTGSTGI
jgi:hypothetical protein